jgi:hypothetical protein
VFSLYNEHDQDEADDKGARGRNGRQRNGLGVGDPQGAHFAEVSNGHVPPTSARAEQTLALHQTLV